MVGIPRGTTIEGLRFGDLVDVAPSILSHLDELKALNGRAHGEVAIREAITELEMWAAHTQFSLVDYKHTNGQTIKIIKEWKEAINSVKDSEALLQSLKNSPYYGQFSDRTQLWEGRLGELDVCLGQMADIQRKWVYLEPIFGRGALPHEASRFARVDADFRLILADVAKDARLISLCSRTGLRRNLEQVVEQLGRCQRALAQFLQEKRAAFPRFYFLGDDDLLEILGQSTNPLVIQAHLRKLFQGIDKVVFGEGNLTLVAMVSADGEVVLLDAPVRLVPQVETWLQHLSDRMASTLRLLTVDALRDDGLNPGKYPSQVLCLAEEVRFCRECERALDSSSLPSLHTSLQHQLTQLTGLQPRDEGLLRLKLKALILDLIHHIDVVQQLITAQARSTAEWTWQRQLRFYLDGDKVVVRQIDARFDYTYEYQGNAPKLVHTPLTDKCYLTLTQAMSMGLGGNPFGPAGTGKTESVKALGALFGRQVLVFNCDEGIDVVSMGRIFVGLVQCGAWGCFDEFNRLEQTVLSAVSQHIQAIQDAIHHRSPSVTLGQYTARVDPNSAIFITLNPAGKGYGGRQKMPDNLKQLFRPVVMSVPDNELIAETLLFAEGFREAKPLARKTVAVFSNEASIVVQALLLNTLSKLTFADSRRFDALIQDIFYTGGPEKKDGKESMAPFGALLEPLQKSAEEMGIRLGDRQLHKLFQLHEQLRQRIGVVVVGPSQSGKSTLWRVLKRALIISGQRLACYELNPKATTRTRLLGHMDMDTREWTDGIITMAARNVIKDTQVHTWIVCDGDIDPEWVEALNSVLDDNRLLTMPSGERIQFGANVNFLFETHHLQFASPATVSRLGMLLTSEEDVSPRDVVEKWVRAQGPEESPEIAGWLEDSFYRILQIVDQRQTTAGIRLPPIALTQNGLSLLGGVRSKPEFLVALYRGFAGSVPLDARKELAAAVFEGEHLPDASQPDLVYFDDRTRMLQMYTEDTGQGLTREQVEGQGQAPPLVLTPNAQATTSLIQAWLTDASHPSICVVGPEGSGKASLMQNSLQTLPLSRTATLSCSAQTSAHTLLHTLHQHTVQVSGAGGRVLRPKDGGGQLIVLLRGLNQTSPDRYGTSQLHALLQQLLTYHGFFDDALEWIGLEGIQFVVTMALEGAGRSKTT
ncbi:unnamed protein product, partial [Mesorhabditis spiculigera]